MTTGDVVYSLRFSFIKVLPEPGFELLRTAGMSSVLITRLHMLYVHFFLVCTAFKPKAYKRFTPTVFIGDDALKFNKKAKYLGFTFNDSKCDDSDMLRQMRFLYVTHYYRHLVIVHQTLKILCFKAIVVCTALYCPFLWNDYISLHLVKFMSRLTMLIEKYLVSPSGVVLVQCMQLIIFVTLRQCYVRT